MPKIIIYLEGGLVQGISSDSNVEIKIVDYDVEHMDEGDVDLHENKYGEKCTVDYWKLDPTDTKTFNTYWNIDVEKDVIEGLIMDE